LANAGWTVQGAGDVEEALEHSAESHVVLLDLRLGESDGFELARRIQAQAGPLEPALLAMSTELSEDLRGRCLQEGFLDTLVKPFRPGELVEVVSRAAARLHEDATQSDVESLDDVPPSLRSVPTLSALWRLERATGVSELLPALKSLEEAGRTLVSAGASGDAVFLAEAAHGLAGVAGILGCDRVEATSRALAVRTRNQGFDEESRLLALVIENELETAAQSLRRKIDAALRT
jgi:CheY-like chemotaxis protein/HPt (histidine-containing phosphotransfer) domain-containing protein